MCISPGFNHHHYCRHCRRHWCGCVLFFFRSHLISCISWPRTQPTTMIIMSGYECVCVCCFARELLLLFSILIQFLVQWNNKLVTEIVFCIRQKHSVIILIIIDSYIIIIMMPYLFSFKSMTTIHYSVIVFVDADCLVGRVVTVAAAATTATTTMKWRFLSF